MRKIKLFALFLVSLSFSSVNAAESSPYLVKNLEAHSEAVHCIIFSPNNEFLISGGADDDVRIWYTGRWRDLKKMEGHIGTVKSFAFSPDKKYLASGSIDKSVRIWDCEFWTEYKTLNTDQSVISLCYSPDGKYLAMGRGNGTIEVWSTEKWKEFETIKAHTGGVNSVCFSKDGKLLVSASRDGIKVWDTQNWDELRYPKTPTNPVHALAFSPDGKILALGGYDKMIEIWNVKSRKKIITLSGHTGTIYSLSFSPDGRFLSSGSGDKTIKIWDYFNGICLRTLEGHTGNVLAVLFSDDQKYFASSSSDRTVKVWEPLHIYAKNQNALLKKIDGEVITQMSAGSDVVIEHAENNLFYVRATLNGRLPLKGWVAPDDFSFEKPDMMAPVIIVISKDFQPPCLNLKGVVYDNSQIVKVWMDPDQELRRAFFETERGTFSDVYPFEDIVTMSSGVIPILHAEDKNGNVSELTIEFSTSSEMMPESVQPEQKK